MMERTKPTRMCGKAWRILLGSALGLSLLAATMDTSEARRAGHRYARIHSHHHARPVPHRPPDYGLRHHHHHHDRWHRHHHHYGRWVAGAAAAATIGAIINSLPRSCRTLRVNGVKYWECGGVYYRQRYQGSNVVYVVVPRP